MYPDPFRIRFLRHDANPDPAEWCGSTTLHLSIYLIIHLSTYLIINLSIYLFIPQEVPGIRLQLQPGPVRKRRDGQGQVQVQVSSWIIDWLIVRLIDLLIIDKLLVC